MPRCEGTVPSAMQPVGKRVSQSTPTRPRARTPASNDHECFSTIDITTEEPHWLHQFVVPLCAFLSFCTQRDSEEQRSKHSSTTAARGASTPVRSNQGRSVGSSVRVIAIGAHDVLRQIGKSRSERKQSSTTTVYRQHPVIPILVNRSCPTCPLVSNIDKGTPCTPPQYAFVKDSGPDRPCTDTDGDWERVFV